MNETFKNHAEKYAVRYLWLGIFFYILIFGILHALKYYAFRYNALDLAIINQVFYNSSFGNFFASSIHPPTYLKDHFSPMLFLLLPFYMLFRHPLTLIVLQNTALAFAAYPLFLISKKYFSRLTSLGIALAWLFNPFVHNISTFEFSFLPFAIFFLFCAILFYKNENFSLFFLFSFLALIAREDIALIVFMFGIIALMEKRKARWVICPFALASLYFLFAMKLIGALRPEGGYKFFIYYAWLGSDISGIVKNLLFHPFIILKRFFSIGNIEMILGFLMPFSFIPVFGWKYLFLALMSYAQIFLGAGGASGLVLKTNYAALFLPALFLAFIEALKKLQNTRPHSLLGRLFLQEKIGVLILIIGVIYSFTLLGPFFSLTTHGISAPVDPILHYKHSLLEHIPPRANVSSSYESLALVSSRKSLSAMNYFFIGKEQFGEKEYNLSSDTEYLFFDFSDFVSYELQYLRNPLYQENFYAGDDRIREKIEKEHFGAIDIFQNTGLFKKGFSSEKIPYKIFSKKPPMDNVFEKTFDSALTLLGYNIQKPKQNPISSDIQEVGLELYWQTRSDIEKNYFLEIQQGSNTQLFPLGYGIYPTDEWKKDEIIQTNYWIALPPASKTDIVALELRIWEIEDGAIFIDSDRGTKNVITKQKQIGETIVIQ